MNIEERAQELERYARGHDDLQAALAALPQAMWNFKPAPKEWSVHEIIIHLADSEMRAGVLLRQARAEPGNPTPDYDRDAWALRLDYPNQDMENALALFKMLRVVSVGMLKNLPEEAFSDTLIHPTRGLMTLDELITLYANHVHVHIRQMQDNFALWQERES